MRQIIALGLAVYLTSMTIILLTEINRNTSLELQKDVLRDFLIKKVNIHQEDKKRLETYFLISMKMNEIIDKNKETKSLKHSDMELMELMYKID